MKKKMFEFALGVRIQAQKFLANEKGDLLGTIGIMMVITLAIVATHGMIKGWLPVFISKVFGLLDGMAN